MDNKLTIAILTYNRLQLLQQTINSVLSSNASNFIFMIFDNASTDGTHEYILELVAKYSFIRYIRHKHNIGMSDNANAVLEQVQSDYVLMLHDDDLIDPNYTTIHYKIY